MRPFFVVIFNGASRYGYAKTHSEKLVWECVNNPAGCPFDAVCINPGVVLGEVLCSGGSGRQAANASSDI